MGLCGHCKNFGFFSELGAMLMGIPPWRVRHRRWERCCSSTLESMMRIGQHAQAEGLAGNGNTVALLQEQRARPCL